MKEKFNTVRSKTYLVLEKRDKILKKKYSHLGTIKESIIRRQELLFAGHAIVICQSIKLHGMHPTLWGRSSVSLPCPKSFNPSTPQ